MITDNGIEILRHTDVLATGCMRLSGKPRGFEDCSRALGTVISFTHVRVLAVLILNHGRPIGTDDSPYQLRKVFAENVRRSRRLARAFFLPVPTGRREVENESGLVRSAMDHRRAVHGPRIC